MNLYRTRVAKCVICGVQTNYHANWFLVVLDQLKVLSWHPRLAELPEMHSACGDQHLRILLQHWLEEANLDLHYTEAASNPALGEDRRLDNSDRLVAGRLLGELAVHRHPVSRVWTGSPQALECILSAITGRETKTRAADSSLAPFQGRRSEDLSRAQVAGWA